MAPILSFFYLRCIIWLVSVQSIFDQNFLDHFQNSTVIFRKDGKKQWSKLSFWYSYQSFRQSCEPKTMLANVLCLHKNVRGTNLIFLVFLLRKSCTCSFTNYCTTSLVLDSRATVQNMSHQKRRESNVFHTCLNLICCHATASKFLLLVYYRELSNSRSPIISIRHYKTI